MHSRRGTKRVRPMTTLVTVTVVTLCFVVAGCSSSSGSDASDTKDDKTTTTAAATDTTKPDDKTPDKTTVPIKIDPDLSIDAAATKALEDIDTSSFCSGVEGFAGLFQALFNGFGSDAERPEATPAEEAAFNKAVKVWGAKMQKVAPPEIADDFALFADDPTGLSAEQTPEQEKASDRVEAYVTSHCKVPKN